MIAYNKKWLYNLFVRQQTDQALAQNLIAATEKKAIYDEYEVGFYSPNLFIRIGLFLLTIVISVFSFGLLALLFLNGIENAYKILLIFCGLVSYIALEVIITNKKHYQSGVDDALLWSAASLIIGGIIALVNASIIICCLLACLVAIFCAVRFVDKLMTVTAFITFIEFIFYSRIYLGSIIESITPFILMGIAALVYLIAKKKYKQDGYSIYNGCFLVLKIISLIAFYCFGNYWVIQHLSETVSAGDETPTQNIHFSWLFWLFTIAIPLVYLFFGVRKKDVVLLRVSLVLVAAMVFTIRYYHSIAPLEIAMTIGGIALVAIGWSLTRFLQTPKFGFTYQELDNKHALDAIKLESLIIAETFSHSPQPSNDFNFGGGTGGGGGASGEF